MLRTLDWLLPTFRTTCVSHLGGSLCCSETSVTNYHYSLSNSPEERSSHPFRSGSLNLTILSDSIKGGKLLNYQLLKGSATWSYLVS